MTVVVSLTGLVVAVVGLLGVVAPRMLVGFLADWRVLTGFPVTLTVRVGIGVLFVVAAPNCRLPSLVWFVGCLEFAGAALLLAAGPKLLRRFVDWWLQRPPPFVRCWCAAAFAFGALLTYAGA